MRANYPKPILDLVLEEEGGWSNNPHDPGGATMKGVIQTVYNRYRHLKGLPTRTVRSITDAELAEIYEDSYWKKVRGDDLPSGPDLFTFDGGVNSGPKQSIKWLQRAVGAKADGTFGDKTLAAVRKADPAETVRKEAASRLSMLQALKNWKYFGKGWGNRVARKEAQSLKMCTAPVDLKAEAAVAQKKSAQAATGAGAGGVSGAGATQIPDFGSWTQQPVTWLVGAVLVIVLIMLVYRWYVQRTRATELANAA